MRNRLPVTIATTLTLFLAFATIGHAEDPAKPAKPTTPATEIDAADKAALDAAANKDVVVTGTIKRARWSNTGKVMTVEFDDSPLIAAVFERNKDAINTAHDGDAAKKWSGAKVKLKGKLGKYTGPQKTYQDRPQIVITKADQVTVLEAKEAPAEKKKE